MYVRWPPCSNDTTPRWGTLPSGTYLFLDHPRLNTMKPPTEDNMAFPNCSAPAVAPLVIGLCLVDTRTKPGYTSTYMSNKDLSSHPIRPGPRRALISRQRGMARSQFGAVCKHHVAAVFPQCRLSLARRPPLMPGTPHLQLPAECMVVVGNSHGWELTGS